MHKFIKLVSKKVDGKNYYSILYLDETDGEIHQGLSSGSLDVISDFLKEFFIKNNDDTEQHAHWEQPSYFDEENGVFRCSKCKEEFVLISGSPKENGYEHCPHCGCKMDGAIRRCGDCTFIDTDCKGYVDEDETFSEVGGCENFTKKKE